MSTNTSEPPVEEEKDKTEDQPETNDGKTAVDSVRIIDSNDMTAKGDNNVTNPPPTEPEREVPPHDENGETSVHGEEKEAEKRPEITVESVILDSNDCIESESKKR